MARPEQSGCVRSNARPNVTLSTTNRTQTGLRTKFGFRERTPDATLCQTYTYFGLPYSKQLVVRAFKVYIFTDFD
jgi:hypothetical protein